MNEVVLAISGSPRETSFTEKMLDLCLRGMGDGLEVLKFYPHRMQISSCTGCLTCWGKARPGECVQKDGFFEILEAYKRADYFLLATPLYIFDFPATVKAVLDRFLVVVEPDLLPGPDNLTMHPKRYTPRPKTLLISSCGFPEIENFDLLRRHFQIIAEHLEWVQAGELLISASAAANVPGVFDEKYALLERAGAELRNDAVLPKTAKQVSAYVMSHEEYRQMVTAYFRNGICG